MVVEDSRMKMESSYYSSLAEQNQDSYQSSKKETVAPMVKEQQFFWKEDETDRQKKEMQLTWFLMQYCHREEENSVREFSKK